MKVFSSKVFQSTAIAVMVATIPFLPALTQSASAEQRICIVDEDRGDIYCGRPASRSEIRRAQREGRFNDSSRGIYGQGDDRRVYNDRDYDYGNDRDNEFRIRNTLNNLYQDILGRSVDRSGLRTYGRRLQNGWSVSRVRKDLANSDEARDRLNDIYRRVLNREIDSDGLKTYRRRLADDWSIYDVEESVRKSDEARLLKRR